MQKEPEHALAIAEHRIAWVLDHPHVSDWLKHALRSARALDPVAALNDIEMLRHLLLPFSTAEIAVAPADEPIPNGSGES